MRCAVLASLCFIACSTAPAEPRPPAVEPSSRTAWVAARASGDVPVLSVPARVVASPESSGAVAPPFQARVARVQVQLGQRVAKDAVVIDVVMPEVLTAAGEASAAELLVAAWQKRREQLAELGTEGLARAGDVAEAEAQLAEAKARLETSRATLRAAGLSVALGRDLLAGNGVVSLRAPVAGVVVEIDATPGAVRAPDAAPFVRIAGTGPVRIEARLPRAASRDTSFSFVVPGGSRSSLTPFSVSPQADPRDGTVLAWFALDGVAPPAGSPGRVEGRLAADASLVVVPTRALRLRNEGALVFARRGEGVAPVRVEVVSTLGAEALVRAVSGETLGPGDELAAEAGLVGDDA